MASDDERLHPGLDKRQALSSVSPANIGIRLQCCPAVAARFAQPVDIADVLGELTEPWEAVKQAGGTPELVSTSAGEVQAFNHLDKADTFPVDRIVAEDYDALVLPGGVANPDALRTDADAVSFVHDFFLRDKPVAAICHAPWTLIEAGVLAGRRLTSWPSLATDIRNAGGQWVDEEVVVDQGLITSRNPEDLPAFCEALVEQFMQARPRTAAI